MIPIVFVLGLIVGRWWFPLVAAVGWATLLLIQGICELACSPSATMFGFWNAMAGVLVHKLVVAVVRFGSRFASAS